MKQLVDIGSGTYLMFPRTCDMDRVTVMKAFNTLISEPAAQVSLMQRGKGKQVCPRSSVQPSSLQPTAVEQPTGTNLCTRSMSYPTGTCAIHRSASTSASMKHIWCVYSAYACMFTPD